MKQLIIGVAICMAVIGLYGGQTPYPTVVKVGVLSAFSGDKAIYKEIVDVIRLRFDEANQLRKDIEFKVIAEDTSFDPKTTYLAAQKLINLDKVDVIIAISSTSQRIATPLGAKNKVPMISLGDENNILFPWSYNYHPTKADTAHLAISTAKTMGIKRITIAALKDAGFIAQIKAWEKEAKMEGIEVAGIFYANPDDIKDFSPHILRMKELHADLNACFMYATETEIFLRQANQLALKNITVMDTLETVQDRRLVANMWLAGEPLLNKEFKNKMRRERLEIHLPYTPYCYDIADIVVQAVAEISRQGHPITRENISGVLAKMININTPVMGHVQQSNGVFQPKPVLIYYDSNSNGRETSVEELLKKAYQRSL